MLLSESIVTFLAGYFSTCRRSKKTKDAYRIDLSQFQSHFLGSERLESIGAERLEEWARELTARQYAPTSIRRKFAALRVFYRYWVRKGELSASPLWRIRLDLASDRRLPRTLTQTEMKRLIEHAWSKNVWPRATTGVFAAHRFLALRNLAIIELLFATGIRVGELVSLNLEDWKEDELCLVINGKGRRQRLAILPDERSVRVMREYLSMRSVLTTYPIAMFTNATGRRLFSQGVARALDCLARGAGIERRVTPHMIRHTAATLLLRNGADIRVVQEMLGHSSISMTERYTHVTKEHLQVTLKRYHPNHHTPIELPAEAGKPVCGHTMEQRNTDEIAV